MPLTSSSLLQDLLRAAGVNRSAEDVDQVIKGVMAAPAGWNPDAWLDLIAPGDAADLRDALRARRSALMADQTSARQPPFAERLARLRQTLQSMGVDGFILPLTDAHRNEYVPAADQRLAWLTGFTGSAGVAVVLQTVAAVFIDGRYTVQAEQQLDHALFERAHLIDMPPSRWLAARLEAGQRLGYDPLLHVKAEVDRYGAACGRAGAELVSLDANPVDMIWNGRPAAPIAPFDLLDERFAGESSASKRRRIAGEIEAAGATSALITAPDSICWLLNIRGGDVPYNPLVLSYALLHADGTAELFLDPRKLRPSQNLGNGVAIRPVAELQERLVALGNDERAVLADSSWTNSGLFRLLGDSGCRIIDVDEPCIAAKARKNPIEIEGARAAQRRDGVAMCRFLSWLETRVQSENVYELEAAARLLSERQKDPLFRGLSFDTISAAGPNAALAHYRVTPQSNRLLAPGSLYLVDSGGQYLDATTDVTRTVAIGVPDDEMRRRFTLVLKGHIAIDRLRFPLNTSGAQIDSIARLPLWHAGLDYDHGTGHGVGSYLCVHEGPARIAKSGQVALAPGMILSNEPGYYKAGAYGMRIENLVIVVDLGVPEGGERSLLGFEALTRVPLDRRLLDLSLLSDEERRWIDSYHAQVRDDLIGHLEGGEREWMLAAAAPLAPA